LIFVVVRPIFLTIGLGGGLGLRAVGSVAVARTVFVLLLDAALLGSRIAGGRTRSGGAGAGEGAAGRAAGELGPAGLAYPEIRLGGQDVHGDIDQEPGAQDDSKADETRGHETLGGRDHLFRTGRDDIHHASDGKGGQRHGDQDAQSPIHQSFDSDDQVADGARVVGSPARNHPLVIADSVRDGRRAVVVAQRNTVVAVVSGSWIVVAAVLLDMLVLGTIRLFVVKHVAHATAPFDIALAVEEAEAGSVDGVFDAAA